MNQYSTNQESGQQEISNMFPSRNYDYDDDDDESWDYYYNNDQYYDDDDDDDNNWNQGKKRRKSDEYYERWKEPSVEEMKDRLNHRKMILEQTLQHRRVHHNNIHSNSPKKNNSSISRRNRRSIVNILYDRETHGCKANLISKRQQHQTRHYHLQHNYQQHQKEEEEEQKQQQQQRAAAAQAAALSPSSPLIVVLERELRWFGEYYAVTKYHSSFLKHLGGLDRIDETTGVRATSSAAVSTISIAFSQDAQTMASTHGDHTVKITCCNTGFLLECLEGHPRTPWTVKFHPLRNEIVASGCLGFQVRVWDWKAAVCMHMVRLDYAIISLSFHPSGHILAVASGSRLHFWDFDNYGENSQGQGVITDVEQRNMLRCVHFPPSGNSIIVGGMNPNVDGRRSMSPSNISFYLRLWDFDLDAALHPSPHTVNANNHSPTNILSQNNPHHPTIMLDNHNTNTNQRLSRGNNNSSGSVRIQRKPLTNPRTVIPRALLYNDGGFDVSSDGKTLCACAEYWLPDGVDNAMDLLHRLKEEYENNNSSKNDIPSGGNDDDNDDDIIIFDKRIIPKVVEEASSLSSSLQQEGSLSSIGGGPTTPTSSSTTTPSRNNNASSSSQQPYISPPRTRISKNRSAFSPPPPPPPNPTSLVPITPPNTGNGRDHLPLSPPSPPGRRWAGGLQRNARPIGIPSRGGGGGPNHRYPITAAASNNATTTINSTNSNSSFTANQQQQQQQRQQQQQTSSSSNNNHHRSINNNNNNTNNNNSNDRLPLRMPHPLSVISGKSTYSDMARKPGRYVPHVVTVSLETTPIPPHHNIPIHNNNQHQHHPTILRNHHHHHQQQTATSVAQGYRPRLGQLLEACPLESTKASAVTCVKFAPSSDFLLLGYGVREVSNTTTSGGENNQEDYGPYHPVTALYKVVGGMKHISTMLSGDDDVNIARFHPDSGYGFVYGTKQGRVRVLSPRPWNYYYGIT